MSPVQKSQNSSFPTWSSHREVVSGRWFSETRVKKAATRQTDGGRSVRADLPTQLLGVRAAGEAGTRARWPWALEVLGGTSLIAAWKTRFAQGQRRFSSVKVSCDPTACQRDAL